VIRALMMLCTVAAGCSGGPPVSADKGGGERRGELKLEPGRPELGFVKVEPVAASDAASVVQLTGKVTFDEDHTQRVASPIDGRATALLVRPGDKVRAGQALLELSSPHVGQLQADAQKAAQDLLVAQKAIDRVHRLREDGAASDKEVAQADADWKKAKADVARTSAQLRSLGLSATDPAVTIALRSQIAGTVVERNVLVGQEVRADAAAPLFTITALDTVWVAADVYEQDLGLVEPGAKVGVSVPAWPGEGFPGKVGHIGDVVDPASRTVKIRCVVPNPGGRLKPEMFARIDLESATGKKLLAIPARAVLADGDKSKVIVAGADHLYRVRTVDVGPETDGKVRVLHGLVEGERIATDGALFLLHEIDNK
jgi:cobalt-zinc-cadmium efflux system membrane fusion protein